MAPAVDKNDRGWRQQSTKTIELVSSSSVGSRARRYSFLPGPPKARPAWAPPASLDAASAACRACDGTYCATVADASDVRIAGACLADGTTACAHAPPGLTDGVALDRCDVATNATTLARLLAAARPPRNTRGARAVEAWCARTLRAARYDLDAAAPPVLSLCRGPRAEKTTIREANSLAEALVARRPAVLRGVAPAGFDVDVAADADVVAMVFDQSKNAVRRPGREPNVRAMPSGHARSLCAA